MDNVKLIAKHLFFLEQVLDTVIEFDIYLFFEGQFKIFYPTTTLLKEEHIKKIQSTKNEYVFIPEDQLRNYGFAVEKKLTSILQQESIPVEKRATILHTASVSLVEEFFGNTDMLKDQTRVTNIVTNMVDFLTNNKGVLSKMLTLSSHDFYTYRHCVDVSIYAILFAKFVGINNAKQLNIFGQAGLFHDLGKKTVSSDIINKKGPLDDNEWKTMKQHPEEGIKILKTIDGISQDIIDGTLYHHEKIDGTGYPFGLSGEKIPFFGRLVAVCDVFSALTTHRSYSKARTPFEALDFMVENMKNKLDKQLLTTFIKLFKG